MFRLYGHAARILLTILLIICKNVWGEANSGDVSIENTLPPSLSTQSTSQEELSQHTSNTSLSVSIEYNTVPAMQPKSKNVPIKKSTSFPPAKTTVLDYNRIPEPGLSFYDIQSEKRIFVDKTKFLEYLLDRRAKFYFVARPTRFGKTIFSQMTSSFFKGEKHNFVGLSIYDRGNGVKRGEWLEYPVIYLDFNVLDLRDVYTVKDFDNKLTGALLRIAKEYDLKYTIKYFRLAKMVNDLKKKKGLPVVIIIEEYDLPVRRALEDQNQKLGRDILHYLNGFFAAIKGSVLSLKLVLVSGVTRLPINGLTYGGYVFVDLTNDEKFHEAMGLTGTDIHNDVFAPFIHKLASCEGMMIDKDQCQEKMTKKRCVELFSNETRCENGLNKEECTAWVKENKDKFWRSFNQWYDGYRFVSSTQGLLNPSSVFECLRRKKMGSYWKCDHSVNLSARRLAKQKLPWNIYENYPTKGNILFSRFDIDDIVPLPVEMLMNGLLTIKSHNPVTDEIVLDFPNNDIREASLQDGNVKEVIKTINNDFLDRKVVRPEKMEESQLTLMLLNYFNTKKVSCKDSTVIKRVGTKGLVGDIDMQTTCLSKNYIIEIKLTELGDWEAVEKFVKYSKADAFQAAIGEQSDVYLLGLQFCRDSTDGQYKIPNWVQIPYHFPPVSGSLCLDFEKMECSN